MSSADPVVRIDGNNCAGRLKKPKLRALRVWIDTDPSIGLWFHDADDAFALTLAATSPELEIAGISISYGNTSQSRAMRIACEWAHAAGVAQERLHPGAVSPGVITNGEDACVRVLESSEQSLDYVALAPLTHLAALLTQHPHVAAKIGRVVFVGGRTPGRSLRMGNRLPYEFHDANFEKDPAAVEKVMQAGIQIDLLPVELGPLCMLSLSDFGRLANGSAVARWLAKLGRPWLRGWRWGFGLKGAPCFDLPAIGALVQPSMFSWEERKLSIQRENARPLLAATPCGEGPGIRFCTGMDPAFVPFCVERMEGSLCSA